MARSERKVTLLSHLKRRNIVLHEPNTVGRAFGQVACKLDCIDRVDGYRTTTANFGSMTLMKHRKSSTSTSPETFLLHFFLHDPTIFLCYQVHRMLRIDFVYYAAASLFHVPQHARSILVDSLRRSWWYQIRNVSCSRCILP